MLHVSLELSDTSSTFFNCINNLQIQFEKHILRLKGQHWDSNHYNFVLKNIIFIIDTKDTVSIHTLFKQILSTAKYPKSRLGQIRSKFIKEYFKINPAHTLQNLIEFYDSCGFETVKHQIVIQYLYWIRNCCVSDLPICEKLQYFIKLSDLKAVLFGIIGGLLANRQQF
jgi:hypothetical protein